jgi:integrase
MLYKRNSSKYYWCRFTAPNGKEVRRTTKTTNKPEAELFEASLISECWRVFKLGDKPRRTWQEAVVKWLDETKHKATHKNDISYLRFADQFLGRLYLDEISREAINQIIEAKCKTGVANGTVNRILEVVRTVLNMAAVQWEWIARAPHVRMLVEPQRRIRWLTRAEVQRLRFKLKPHMRDMMDFSLATGLRESNVTRLGWSEIDLARKVAWVHPDESKSGKAIGIPLNADAMRVLKAQWGKHSERVFTYIGKPVKNANTRAWRQVLKDVGIKDFRWHDLRHTWASWHVQNGTRLEVLRELGGWSDIKTVLKYAHLAPEHLAQHAENICDDVMM